MTRSNEFESRLDLCADSPDSPLGVMTAEYSRQRREQPHVAFRLASRAIEAITAFREFAKAMPGTPPAILDLGAADGATLEIVHAALGASDSVGIEYARELIEAAPALAEGIRLVEGDVTKPHPEVAEESRDLVLALAVLEHLETPELLFEQAFRALKPGGLVVATCPSGVWDEISGWFHLHPEEHHEQAFDRSTFEALAASAGFEAPVYRRFMNAPFGFLPYLRVPVSPDFARRVDTALRALRVLDFVFVNQLFIARKPTR